MAANAEIDRLTYLQQIDQALDAMKSNCSDITDVDCHDELQVVKHLERFAGIVRYNKHRLADLLVRKRSYDSTLSSLNATLEDLPHSV